MSIFVQMKNQKHMSDANKQHQQELYKEKISNKRNQVDRHVKETISSIKKQNKKYKIKKRKIATRIQILLQ